jgi:beta-glucosidase
MPWRDKVTAIVQAWYPGQTGGQAIAEILTGTVNPSDHLPITFPASLAQTPRPELPEDQQGREGVAAGPSRDCDRRCR